MTIVSKIRMLVFVARRVSAGTVLLAATALYSSAADAPLIPDSEIVARSTALSLEERRYLVYLYARLDKPHVAESLAESLLAAAPGDRSTLLALASIHLEQKNAEATLRATRRLLAGTPNDPEALHFLALGHYLARDFAAAHRLLRELKQTQFAGRKFPYEADLAAAAFAEGDWRRAMLAYEELQRHDDLADDFRADVRQALDSIYREHLPRFDVTAAQVHLDRAEVWRAGAVHGRHLGDRYWLEQRYGRDDVSLDDAPGTVSSRHIREEFAAHLAMVHDGRWRTDAWLGASGEGAFGGARTTHTFAPQREAALELAVNTRATDSLALEALDGRQHQLAFNLSWLVAPDLSLSLRAHARELRVARETLGRATGADVNLDYTLRRRGPRFTVGYRGSFARFSADGDFDPAAVAPIADPLGGLATQQALAANLVSPRLNRHGAGLLLTDNLARAWVYRLTAGVDYDFELTSTAWNGALALTFSPHHRVEFTAEAGYTSSAAASNAGSAATLLNFFLRVHY